VARLELVGAVVVEVEDDDVEPLEAQAVAHRLDGGRDQRGTVAAGRHALDQQRARVRVGGDQQHRVAARRDYGGDVRRHGFGPVAACACTL